MVVLGAQADPARSLLTGLDLEVVLAEDWAEGMGASLRAGLRALLAGSETAAVITLVDLPDVDAAVIARVLGTGAGPGVLARATYDARPGHPVLIGREHWAALIDSVGGDRGARDYLAAQRHRLVECGDLATGVDVDEEPGPEQPVR